MKNKQLVSRIGVVLVATALGGASAFAESRPSNETRGHRGEGGRISRGSSDERSSASRRDNSSNGSRQREGTIERRSQRRESDRTDRTDSRVEVRGERAPRSEVRDGSSRNNDRSTRSSGNDRSTRNDNDRYRNNDRSDRGRYDRDRNDRGRNDNYRSDRSRSYGRSDSHYRQPYWSHGRVSRVHRYGGGYRVWIVGSPFPFYIPIAYYRHDRFRVGLSIRLGGYYNNAGYYDYYDGESDGAIRGTVESVDYRHDSFVVRNDATGSFVTVLSRDRRVDVRAGDFVELSGEWTRSGVFTAWDVNFVEDEYRR